MRGRRRTLYQRTSPLGVCARKEIHFNDCTGRRRTQLNCHAPHLSASHSQFPVGAVGDDLCLGRVFVFIAAVTLMASVKCFKSGQLERRQERYNKRQREREKGQWERQTDREVDNKNKKKSLINTKMVSITSNYVSLQCRGRCDCSFQLRIASSASSSSTSTWRGRATWTVDLCMEIYWASVHSKLVAIVSSNSQRKETFGLEAKPRDRRIQMTEKVFNATQLHAAHLNFPSEFL